jgi:hypothetical protein
MYHKIILFRDLGHWVAGGWSGGNGAEMLPRGVIYGLQSFVAACDSIRHHGWTPREISALILGIMPQSRSPR